MVIAEKEALIKRAWDYLRVHGWSYAEIAEKLEVSKPTICVWLKQKLGKISGKTFRSGVIARKTEILNKIGWDNPKIARLLGSTPQTVSYHHQWVSPQGNPYLIVRVDEKIRGLDKDCCYMLSWYSDEEGLLERMNKKDDITFVQWERLRDNVTILTQS